MSKNERDELWDSLYEKEEGIILEFNMNLNSGNVKSIKDGTIYKIDSSEMIKTKIKLRPCDKVVFALKSLSQQVIGNRQIMP